MWRHFYNMVRLGCQGIYISMFDEYNEGNQIAKTAESAAMQPTNFNRPALDEDGVACSSDYYLRITADGGRMLKGQLALTAVRPTQPVVGGGDNPVNLAAGRPVTASSTNGPFVPGNAVDGNPNSYWESVNNTFPQWLQVDLGTVAALSTVVLGLPASWGSRVQTLSILVSADGSSFSTVVGSAGRTFAPSASIPLPAGTTGRYVRVQITANTGWPAGQVGEFQVWGGAGTPPPPPPSNLARGKPTAESSHTQVYGSGNVVDGDPSSYWESASNAFPQWVQVDLGAATAVSRVVLRLPPATAWGTRTQTLAIQGSGNGSTFTDVVGSAAYTFNPSTGNTVTVTFPTATTRYVRINLTSDTGRPAGPAR
jgi:hypothetical protein